MCSRCAPWAPHRRHRLSPIRPPRSTINVYYIWYGNWSGNSASTILTNLAQHIGPSPYFNIGQENADKRAWTFGATYSAANGSQANMKFGTMDYLIQRNWVNANGGYCALSY